MKKYSLYYSPWCPFCIKVLAHLKSLPVEVELRNTQQKEHYLALSNGNGRTQVPCLLIEEGESKQWMLESDDIINYLKGR